MAHLVAATWGRTDTAVQDCITTAARDPQPTHQREGVRAGRAAKAKGLRIAVATLISANNQDPCKGNGVGRPYGCGLLPWCVSARRLQSALAPLFRSVEVIAVHASRLSNENAMPSKGQSVVVPGYEGGKRKMCRFNIDTERLDLADCPGVRIISPTARMLNVSLQHAERVVGSGKMSYYPNYIRRGYVFLWKWEYWRLGREFDAVLHADLDVDLLPSPTLAPRIATEWSERLPPLVSLARRSGADSLRMLGYSDVSTPYNGGLFWAFPPSDSGIYNEGLDVLSAPWDPDNGWERAGPPRLLFPHGTARQASGKALRNPSQMDAKSWTQIDSGDLDQGFLLYMMQHRNHCGAYMQGDSLHRPQHYVGAKFKPWMRALNYFPLSPATAVCSHENLVRQAYMRGAGLDKGETQSACAIAFLAAAEELDAQLNRTECCASLSWPPDGSVGGRTGRGFGATPLLIF